MKLTDAQKKEVVNKGFCKTQHTFLNTFIGILCALTIGLIVVAVACGGISWRSIETSNEATEAAGEVEKKLEVHQAEQNGSLSTINHRLKSIEEDVNETNARLEEQRKMIEDIWKRGS